MINSDYRAPLLFSNRHLHTIYPTLFRRVKGVSYRREQLATADGDILDLDWSAQENESLAIISHGLEGDSRRSYVKGMVRAMNRAGLDALAWNFRGCSNTPSRRLAPYNNCDCDDLQSVVYHAMASYRSIFLIGFSMGGNLNLNYLGRRPDRVPGVVKGSVSFSVPCDLAAAAEALARRENFIYMRRFLRLLHEKVRAKQKQFPGQIDDHDYHRLKSFKDFDDRYTAPLNGFVSAEDYWQKCSCRPWLKQILVPSLIVNAEDDPFLINGCYPLQECADNPQVQLEITRRGGHVGFMGQLWGEIYWSEQRAMEFIRGLQTQPDQ